MSTSWPSFATALADRYRLERELGQGGMATVYLAHDLRHDGAVALKVLSPDLAASLGAARFQREIQLVCRLQHPHILPVLDSGECDGLLWYAMPYVTGGSLRDRLRRDVQLPVGEALRIALEAARALVVAHGQGIVHRDVKPENLLLAADGSVLVADFGIARVMNEVGERLTATGLVVGTPLYMSPEQAAGTSSVDARTDVYALGCVLYEMLAGEPPHTGPTPQAIIARRMTEVPRPLRAVREAVPPVVEALVARCLTRVPADRPADAGVLAAELEFAWAQGTTSGPYAPTVVSGTRAAGSTVARRRAAWGAALLALLAASGAFGWLRAHRSTTPTNVRVAVLPFESNGDTALASLAEGMSEELTNRLAHVPGLTLMARASVLRYRQSGQSATEFARSLGVDYVVDGTVRGAAGAGGRREIRITPEVTKVADGTHVWGEPYAGVLENVFDVQADVAQRVAEALGGRLGASERARLRAAPTADVEAYRLYLLGSQALGRRWTEPARAVGYLEQAVAHDPGYARAHAALAVAYSMARDFTATMLTRDSLYVQARRAAERAVALDPTLSEAHTALGRVLEAGDWNWRRADEEFRTAVRLDSTDAMARQWYALHLVSIGRTREAVEEARAAVRLDPLTPLVGNALGIAFWFDRRPDSAIVAFDRMLATDPQADGAANLLFLYLTEGRYEAGAALLERLHAPDSVVAIYRRAADPMQREALVRFLLQQETSHAVRAFMLATVPQLKDEALRELELAAEAKEERLILILRSAPPLDPLRGDPRLAALLRRLGFESEGE